MDFVNNCEEMIEKENDENLCIVDEKSIYTKANRILIAKIVYQCIDCELVFNTINDVYCHYFDSHHNCHQKSDISISVETKLFISSSVGIKQNSKTINKKQNKARKKLFTRNKKLKNARNKLTRNKNSNNKSDSIDDTLKSVNNNILVSKSSEVTPVYKCDDCDNTYFNVYSLRRHHKIHTNPKVCDYFDCGKLFATEKQLISHLKIHRSDKKSMDFKCDECGKAFTREETLKLHKNMHINPLVCDFPKCNKKFPSYGRLRQHAIMHSSESPLKCDWPGCDFTTKRIACVAAHKQTVHTNERAFKCDWPDCPDSFKTSTSLKNHVNGVHKKERNYHCEWPGCEKRFAGTKDLIRHRRTHTGEKPYACDWPLCGQRFSDRSVLKYHKNTHTGERPFCCDWPSCGARFGTSGTLNTHKKLIHKCDYIRRARWDNKKINN